MIGRALRVLRDDLLRGLRHLWVNALGGWFLTPRAVRFLVYRAAGIDVRTANIADACRFRGSAATTIGAGTFVNRECYVEAVAPVVIGRRCRIAMQVMILTSTHELTADGRFSPTPTARPVTIGDDCWLGARAVVLPGVTIGDGVVVAAGAVVTKVCAPHGLYAGNPAVRIRELALLPEDELPGLH